MTTLKQAIDLVGEVERHADPIDIASDRSAQEVTHLVREASNLVIEQEAAAAAAVTGKCLHCDTPVEAPRRWCDAYCRDAQQAEQKASYRRGY